MIAEYESCTIRQDRLSYIFSLRRALQLDDMLAETVHASPFLFPETVYGAHASWNAPKLQCRKLPWWMSSFPIADAIEVM